MNKSIEKNKSYYKVIVFFAVIVLLCCNLLRFKFFQELIYKKQKDTVILIDDSGSMKTNDRNNLRIEVGIKYLNMLSIGSQNRVAILKFGNELIHASNLPTLLTINDNNEKYILTNQIRKFKELPGTNYNNALLNALAMFDKKESQKNVIMITDGEPEESIIDIAEKDIYFQRLNSTLQTLKSNKVNLFFLELGRHYYGDKWKEIININKYCYISISELLSAHIIDNTTYNFNKLIDVVDYICLSILVIVCLLMILILKKDTEVVKQHKTVLIDRDKMIGNLLKMAKDQASAADERVEYLENQLISIGTLHDIYSQLLQADDTDQLKVEYICRQGINKIYIHQKNEEHEAIKYGSYFWKRLINLWENKKLTVCRSNIYEEAANQHNLGLRCLVISLISRWIQHPDLFSEEFSELIRIRPNILHIAAEQCANKNEIINIVIDNIKKQIILDDISNIVRNEFKKVLSAR